MKSDVEISEGWTEVIEAKRKWYDINFKELWHYRDLVKIFVRRDIISLYKQTILGPVWFFIAPLFTVFTYTFVFSRVARLSTEGVPAAIFYLAGVTLWSYFQSCFTATSNTFSSNAGIFGKVYFPRLVSPISVVLSNLVKFGFQLILFAVLWVYYFQQGKIFPNLGILLFPFLLILMAGISLGLGIIISSLTIKYKDLTYFVTFGIGILMYASAVIYPLSAVPPKFKSFLLLNPIIPIMETFRYSFMGAGEFRLDGLIYSTFFMITTLIVGIVVFNKVERTFIDTI